MNRILTGVIWQTEASRSSCGRSTVANYLSENIFKNWHGEMYRYVS